MAGSDNGGETAPTVTRGERHVTVDDHDTRCDRLAFEECGYRGIALSRVNAGGRGAA
jgi:hypothetical protein